MTIRGRTFSSLFTCWLIRLPLIAILCFSIGCESLKDSSLAPGRSAPDINLADLDGKSFKLSDFKGKTVILNFLASWCKPCEEEMPSLNRLQNKLKDTVQVVAVGIEDDDAALREFRDRNKVVFPFLHDKSGNSKQRYRIAGYPETFVIDAKGNLMLFPDPWRNNTPTLKFVGPKKWDSPSMIALLKQLSATGNGKS